MALLGSLSACVVTEYREETARDYAKRVDVSGVKFDDNFMYTGEKLFSSTAHEADVDNQLAWLYAEQSKVSSKTTYYVLANVRYVAEEYRRYTKVRFADSDKTWAQIIEKKKYGNCYTKKCGFEETVRFVVTQKRLRNWENLEFRLESNDGVLNQFEIPKNYIEGFLLVAH